MARIFIYDNREFPDPDPNMSPEDVRASLSEFFGDINNAEIHAETRGSDTLYRFEKRVGTKGAGNTVYRGYRGPMGATVTVEREGQVRELPMRLDLRNHSPSGLEWGYLGSGPSQLALAILADGTRDDQYATKHYQQFKMDVISTIQTPSIEIPESQVEQWVRNNP